MRFGCRFTNVTSRSLLSSIRKQSASDGHFKYAFKVGYLCDESYILPAIAFYCLSAVRFLYFDGNYADIPNTLRWRADHILVDTQTHTHTDRHTQMQRLPTNLAHFILPVNNYGLLFQRLVMAPAPERSPKHRQADYTVGL